MVDGTSCMPSSLHTDRTCNHSHKLNEPATQKMKSGKGSPDQYVTFAIHLQTLLWDDHPGHVGVMGNDRADRSADKRTIASGLRLRKS